MRALSLPASPPLDLLAHGPHAALQLDFLSTLAQYTKYGVVFATHSVGLNRTAADRIYTQWRPACLPLMVSAFRPSTTHWLRIAECHEEVRGT